MFNQKEYMRRYRIDNKEKRKKYMKQWKKDNPKKVKEEKKLYRKNNLEKRREADKKYYNKHKEEKKEYDKIYRKNNREKIRKKNMKLYNTNLKFNINNKMGLAIRKSLKGNKNGRHWETLVGYTLKDLIRRLKKTIPKGYIWRDYLEGKLHVDHIIPKSIFHFSKSEHIDFQKCWALSNLQLLPAKENLIKGAKLSKPFQPALKLSLMPQITPHL